MIFTHTLDESMTLTLNLTETLLIGEQSDAQHIFCENIGISRELSKISYLYSELNNDENLVSLEGILIKAMLGSIGSSQIAILPQKISSMLMKGWSYPARLNLLWSVISKLNKGNTFSNIVCFPSIANEASSLEGAEDFTVSGLLKPLSLHIESVGDNLLLCNPAYYPLLIVESGLSQQEFSHVESYIRGGGNVIFSVDNAVFDNQRTKKNLYDGDQMRMRFG